MTECPDFIILGGYHNGQVYLIASREVLRAQLDTTRNYEAVSWRDPLHLRDERTDISAEVRGYVVVMADTYQHAWESLFRQWSPPGRPELATSRKELTID